ncbi:MAG: hypothetical protein ACRDT4_27300 [Micromonosporaceae bacterium]
MPSPITQLARVAWARAVTVMPGTLAVADREPQLDDDTHSHVGNRTNFSPLGLDRTCTAGSTSRLAA